jgi:hypothetical protein
MSKPAIPIWLAATVLSLLSAPAYAQSCRINADTAAYLRDKVGSYALATDSVGKAVRDSLRIDPAASASAVVLITKSTTCASANTAYKSALTGGLSATFSNMVYVVQSGKSYVVWDPSFKWAARGGSVYVVFDSRWTKKSIFE